ncbi:MAG: beta-lactamase family protein [Pseudomonadaceae bacterium]|nr:beta-lactamase family protein [Pseudomonadaceae bacterium]
MDGRKRVLASLALVFGVVVTGCTPNATNSTARSIPALSESEIDSTIERLMAANDVKGLAVVLIEAGGVTFAKGYGHRMVEKDLPLEPDTIIYGASLTKATFAYLVMQLVDEGVVELDKSIADYLPRPLPDYENYRDLVGDARWRDLTLRMLLSHTPGFANFRWFDPAGDDKLRFHFDPGTRYAYSGEGFRLAQFVLEEGLGLDVGEEMQARIFDRFGMTKTSMTWREDFLENYSHNYTMTGENIRHTIRETVGAAGSMDTTPADWGKFLAAVVRGDGLSAQAKQEMTSAQIRIHSETQFPTLSTQTTDEYDGIQLSYGLGWGVFESVRGRAFFKEGHDDGTANYALCIEQEASCILLMSNSVRAEGIFKEVVDTLFGETGLPWRWEGYEPQVQVGER